MESERLDCSKNYSLSKHAVLIEEADQDTGRIIVVGRGPLKVFHVNRDAFVILKLIQRGFPPNVVLRALKDQQDMSQAAAREKLVGFLSRLLRCGAITCSDRPSSPYQIKTMRMKLPLTRIFLEVTAKCNYSCFHCYARRRTDDSSQELSLDELKNIIDQAYELGVFEVDVTGGETGMREDILQLLEYMTYKGMILNVYSNGTLLNDAFFSVCENLRIQACIISLDGYRPDTHDRFRGVPGAFVETVQRIMRLRANSVNLRVNITPTKDNLEEIPHLIDFAYRELGAASIAVAPIVPAGYGAYTSHLNAPNELVAELQVAACGPMDPDRMRLSDRSDLRSCGSCGVGRHMLFIGSTGDVALCPTLTAYENPTFRAGNIRANSLRTIWETGPAFVQYRGIQCNEISTCRFASACRGGCRSRAYLREGSLTSKDDLMCLEMELLFANKQESSKARFEEMKPDQPRPD